MDSNTVYTPTPLDFPFSDITLANPQGLQGGAYFSRLKLYDDRVPIQTPKCQTKNGIHKTEKKIYCDLMFDDDNYKIIEWANKLENKIKNLIFEKRDIWFNSEMDMDTIDYHWQPILRVYKGTKRLLRCFIKKPKTSLGAVQTAQIYDEDENLLQLDDVEKNKLVVAILEIGGLKFTTQSFSVEFHLKQMMILKNRKLTNRCLIKIDKPKKILAKEEFSSKPDEDVPSLEENKYNDTDNELSENLEDNDKPKKVHLEISDFKSVPLDISSNTIPSLHKLVDNSLNILSNADEDDDKPTQNNPTVEKDVSQNILDNLVGNLEEKDTAKKIAPTVLVINQEPLDKNEELNEINLVMPADSETIQLKKPNEVYLEIYKEARRRAKEAKMKAIQAYLEAKRIKSNYLLDEIESSDDDSEFLEGNYNG